MKNGIETRPNGNRILKHGTYSISYHVQIIRANGTFRDSRNGPWDYLRNARDDADRQEPLGITHKSLKSEVPLNENLAENIMQLTADTNIIQNRLRQIYLPLIDKCETLKEAQTMFSDIKRSLGIECGSSLPGTFEVDVMIVMQKFIKEEK